MLSSVRETLHTQVVIMLDVLLIALSLYHRIVSVSCQDTSTSQLFARLSVRSDYMDKITNDTSAVVLRTDNVMECGLVCSKLDTCSGLQYEKETKVCRKMKKVERRDHLSQDLREFLL